MTSAHLMLLLATVTPWIGAVAIFSLGERRLALVKTVALSAALATAVGALGTVYQTVLGGSEAASLGWPLLGTRFEVTGDLLGALFAVVAAGLWLPTTVYAIGYLSHSRDLARFFGFFSVCIGSAIGVAYSANLLTLFVFYEALTLATYPLVVHSGSTAAMKAGRTYLYYALSGGAALAAGIIWLYSLGGAGDFASGSGISAELLRESGSQLVAIFALLIMGFGVKAAIMPLHGWLPAAMAAPAPVSALLHAVAVVKAGVFGVARTVLDVFGVESAEKLGVLVPLAAIAAVTIVVASLRALQEDDIKKRLAYSTIGQLSYIVLGIAIGAPIAVAAALAHIAHHALLKITMFFTAGVLAEEVGITRVSQMDGVGRRMPLTMTAFSVAALGIVGVPPIAGFVTKWGLASGSLADGLLWPTLVLSVSTLLNAAYLMPMIGRAWFREPAGEWAPLGRRPALDAEGDRRMVWPLVLTAAGGLAAGVFSGAVFSPAAVGASIAGAAAAAASPWSGTGFALDLPGTFFLVLSLIVWSAAAVISAGEGHFRSLRFTIFFLMTLLGSLGLSFSVDATLFYASFSLMALSTYGLVVHTGTEKAMRAGRLYMAYTTAGEALLLLGLLIGSAGDGAFAEALATSPWRDLGIAALLLSFGIKVGGIGLGGWMPAAYGATPAGVNAAVAGVVSTAGILGMLRFMPAGELDLTAWGTGVAVAGIATALYAAVAGWLQSDPRHVLAYSSMSQFGIMAVGVGAGLARAELWPAAVAAVSVYFVHHGIAKASLFAGSDAYEAGARRWLWTLLLLPALALTGLPLTSGGVAKVALKKVVDVVPEAWAPAMVTMLSVAAVGTTLLVWRFLVLHLRTSAPGVQPTAGRLRSAGFIMLLLPVVPLTWVLASSATPSAGPSSVSQSYLWSLVWPVIVGAVLALGMTRLTPSLDRGADAERLVGDPFTWLSSRVDVAISSWPAKASEWRASGRKKAGHPVDAGVPGYRLLKSAAKLESTLLTWPVASGIFAMVALLVLVLAG